MRMPPQPPPYIIKEIEDKGTYSFKVIAQYCNGIHVYLPYEEVFEGGILECEAYIRLKEKGILE